MAVLFVLPGSRKAYRTIYTLTEKLKHTKPAEKKRWPKHHKVSSWHRHHSLLHRKEKEQGHPSTSQDPEERES